MKPKRLINTSGERNQTAQINAQCPRGIKTVRFQVYETENYLAETIVSIFVLDLEFFGSWFYIRDLD